MFRLSSSSHLPVQDFDQGNFGVIGSIHISILRLCPTTERLHLRTGRSEDHSSTFNDVIDVIWTIKYLCGPLPLGALPRSISLPNLVHKTHISTASPILNEQQNCLIQNETTMNNQLLLHTANYFHSVLSTVIEQDVPREVLQLFDMGLRLVCSWSRTM